MLRVLILGFGIFGLSLVCGLSQALAESQNAAKQTNAQAESQYELGQNYLKQGKATEAVKCFREAAEQGFAPAQVSLGICYFEGEGIGKDFAEAVKWFGKAAEQGDAEIMRNMAQYLGVASSEMIKTTNVIQNSIKAQTRFTFGTGVIARQVVEDFARGKAAGLSYEESMKLVAKGQADMAEAVSSDPYRKLTLLAHNGNAWAKEALEKGTGVSAAEINREFIKSGMFQEEADDVGFVQRFAAWDTVTQDKVYTVMAASVQKERLDSVQWNAIDSQYRMLEDVRGATSEGRTHMREELTASYLDNLEKGTSGAKANYIRAEAEKMRAEGKMTEEQILGAVRTQFDIDPTSDKEIMRASQLSIITRNPLSREEVFERQYARVLRENPRLDTDDGRIFAREKAEARTNNIMREIAEREAVLNIRRENPGLNDNDNGRRTAQKMANAKTGEIMQEIAEREAVLKANPLSRDEIYQREYDRIIRANPGLNDSDALRRVAQGLANASTDEIMREIAEREAVRKSGEKRRLTDE